MRILIADRTAQVRSALCLLLSQSLSSGIISEVGSLSALLRELPTSAPELLLLEWHFSTELDGALLIDLLHQRQPGLRVVVLSSQPEIKAQAMAAGAAGFICKTDYPAHVLSTLTNEAALRSGALAGEDHLRLAH